MNLRLCESNKLHYGNYLYKLVIYNRLANIFRTEFQKDGGLGYARQKLDECNLAYKQARKDNSFVYRFMIPWQIGSRIIGEPIHVEQYFDAIKIYRILKKHSDYKIRIEHNQLYLYSNDKAFIKKIVNACEGNGEFWEPPVDSIEKITKEKNVIISEKPVEYKYKITLGGKKGNPSLVSWIDANPALAKIGSSAREQCLQAGWVKGYYFYVRDDKTLLICEMIVGNNIQRIDRFVYRYE